MTNANNSPNTLPRTSIAHKIVSCACATALTLSLGVVAPLDRVLPDQFEGGAAYAATSMKAGAIKGTASATTAKASAKTAATVQNTLLRAGAYRITSAASSSLAVDVPSGAQANNQQLQLWSVNNMTPQTYVFNQVATNVFTIQAACSGKYLADSNGRVVQQSKSATSLYQRWQVVKEGGNLALKNVKSGRMLATSSATRNGKLITRTQRSTSYEQWRFTSVNLIPNGTYMLGSALGNNQMLDVAAASTANGANVQIYANNGTNAQKWQITHVGNGYYKIINAATGKALDVYSGNSNVRQYTYGSNYATELWRFEVSYKGGYLLVNKYNGKALDVTSSRAVSGSNVATYAKGSYDSERWNLYGTTKINPGTRTVSMGGTTISEVTNYNGEKTVTIPNGMYTVRNAMGRMLDVSAGSTAAGANVQIYANNGTNAQKWNITSVGGGYYTFQSVISGYSLDVVNGRNANGTNVRQWYANTSGAQRWKAELYGSNLVFVNQATGKVLDVDGGVNADCRNVQIWDRNNSAAQQWTLTKTAKKNDYSATAMTSEERAVAYDIFNAYNNYRASKGLRRLPWNENMSGIAFNCSKNCAKLGYLKHGTAIPNYHTNRQTMSDILQYATWKMSGSEAVGKWKNSTGHRRMMQCTTATSAGVGVYNDNGKWYYTIVYNFSGTNQNGA